MSTTTTVPAVIDAVLSTINADLTDVTAYETWPGPEASAEMVVLGEIRWTEYQIVTVKTARKQRDEEYEIDWFIYVAGEPGTTPDNPKPARDRAFEIMESLEDVLANDPAAGLGYASIIYIQVAPGDETTGPVVFEKGWAYRIPGKFRIRARLF